eukprot:5588575-Amphidinium_carterae.2
MLFSVGLARNIMQTGQDTKLQSQFFEKVVPHHVLVQYPPVLSSLQLCHPTHTTFRSTGKVIMISLHLKSMPPNGACRVGPNTWVLLNLCVSVSNNSVPHLYTRQMNSANICPAR